jgi:hypothetical protein
LLLTSVLRFFLVIKTDFIFAPEAGLAVNEIVAIALNFKVKSAVGATIVNVGAPGSVPAVVDDESPSFEQDVNNVAAKAKAAIDLNNCFIFIYWLFYLLQINHFD